MRGAVLHVRSCVRVCFPTLTSCFATERKKDLLGLQLPGHVFYIKSRKLKQGATLQRVLRGNWQEEVLWNIHDIVVSKKMLDHHTLAAYIRTLNRC